MRERRTTMVCGRRKGIGQCFSAFHIPSSPPHADAAVPARGHPLLPPHTQTQPHLRAAAPLCHAGDGP